ncbi:sigma-70 family RNA polymerase sigma factor (plasmid) [Paraclostridium ghonii]|uniref:sigma-70 family RNA polymerase sigma factor n=1 Tax=Paraclostridium ghonii TaxID=29358 RepID=UPI00202CDD18|nr:sigma-70 family RNA polymerase sigma factor [Paeniclostridium ghonii]MCM0165817.1 sigma-70 family RNA polymerase sigma factor [Paeniclostridium ghonii]
MQDELIIKYIKKKKQKGIEMLIDKYSGLVASVVRSNLGKLTNYEEECISDAFIAIWDNIDSFDRNKNSFKNWICVIAKYKAINYKKKYLSKYETSEINADIYYIDKNLLSLEIKEGIEDIFKHLDSKDKDIFIKYYLEGVDAPAIAKENNLSVSSFYSRLSRGRKKIREEIRK